MLLTGVLFSLLDADVGQMDLAKMKNFAEADEVVMFDKTSRVNYSFPDSNYRKMAACHMSCARNYAQSYEKCP